MMDRFEAKTKYHGLHRRIFMEIGRTYRVVPLNERKTKNRNRECVLVEIVPVSASHPDDKVAKIRFTDNNRIGRADFGDLLPVGALYDGEYTEDDPTHRPEDYGWDGLDIAEEMLQDMVFRAEHGIRLTAEQREALARNHPNTWLYQQEADFIPMPSNPKKITKEQSVAAFGGPERSALASEWFQLELMALNIQKMMDDGETEFVNENGSRVPLQDLMDIVRPQRDKASVKLAAYDRESRFKKRSE
jgi:hypothetical protein